MSGGADIDADSGAAVSTAGVGFGFGAEGSAAGMEVVELRKEDIFKCRCEISQSLTGGGVRSEGAFGVYVDADWQDMPDGRLLVENMENWEDTARPQFEEMYVRLSLVDTFRTRLVAVLIIQLREKDKVVESRRTSNWLGLQLEKVGGVTRMGSYGE